MIKDNDDNPTQNNNVIHDNYDKKIMSIIPHNAIYIGHDNGNVPSICKKRKWAWIYVKRMVE